MRVAPEEELLARELKSRIAETLHRLPPDWRAVMEPTHQGWSPSDIAESLSWPLPKVYRLLCKARKYLVEELSLSLPSSSRGRPKQAGPGTPEPRSSDR
jgi:DNA-directed RNA polymerase specialized sigma24 family protein